MQPLWNLAQNLPTVNVRLPFLFRFSLYLSLGLSTTALAYASHVQMPALDYFYFVMGLLLIAAGLTDGRWHMSNRISNVVGLVIGILAVVWYVGQKSSGIEAGEWLAQLLPWGGVLLGVLLLAKLLRPKNISDYWTINVIALVQVVLACVFAMGNKLDRDAPIFPLVLLSYLLSLVWALRNLTLYNDAVLLRRRVGETVTELHQRSPRAPLGIFASWGWFLLIILIGLTIYFAVPRPRTPLENIFGSTDQTQTGYNSNLDLNATGEVAVTDELVFEVQAMNTQRQPVPIPDGQRWRGDTCAIYRDGKWSRARERDMITFGRSFEQNRVQSLWWKETQSWFRLHFRLDVSRVPESENSGLTTRFPSEVPLFNLDPYAFMEGMTVDANNPLLFLTDSELEPLDIDFRRSTKEAITHATNLKRRTKKLMYYQDVPSIREQREWSQLIPEALKEFHRLDDETRVREMVGLPKPTIRPSYYSRLVELPDTVISSGKIRTTTESILQKLRTQGKLSARASRKEIAVALEQYLAFSGDYSYSLFRDRRDETADPTEDFLCNVKTGHCARFASALALMLRSQGIPSRIVLGFRGSEWNASSEMHEVRGLHAHAWVEALVEEEDRTTLVQVNNSLETRYRVWLKWAVLDPTPSTDGPHNRRSYLANNLSFARSLWEFFILDFTGPEQRQRFRSLFSFLGGETLLAWWQELSWLDVAWISATLLCLVLFVIIFGKRLWYFLRTGLARLRGQALLGPIRIAFFDRFLRILQRHQITRAPWQTPAEFIAEWERRLQHAPATALVAHVPTEVVDQFYAVRFGQSPLDASLAVRMDKKLDALEEALLSK